MPSAPAVAEARSAKPSFRAKLREKTARILTGNAPFLFCGEIYVGNITEPLWQVNLQRLFNLFSRVRDGS